MSRPPVTPGGILNLPGLTAPSLFCNALYITNTFINTNTNEDTSITNTGNPNITTTTTTPLLPQQETNTFLQQCA